MRSQPTPTIEDSVVNKVGRRLTPFLALLYVFCLLDRSNISFATLQMQPALHFSDDVYGTGAGIFFIGYFLFEVPSNLIMERVGARRWIARIMITWGLLSASMMFVHTPTSLYVLRFLLGVAEAGFFPGVVLYLTYWIPATSRARAMSRFLAWTGVLQLVGAPLASVFLGMNGWHGLGGWQWLFLMEGIPSALMAFVVLAVLPDKPAHANWLTDEEKNWLTARLEKESQHEHCVHKFTLKTALTEPRIRQLCLVFILTATAGNAVGYFAPKLIKAVSGGTWSDSAIPLWLGIPEVLGALAMLLASRHSDRTGRRTGHVSGGYMVGGLGFLCCLLFPGPLGIVAALSLSKVGERVGAGSYWALTTNLLGAGAAAGGIAMINSVGNLGGFIGPKMMGWFLDHTNHSYALGLSVAAALMAVAAVMGALLRRQPVHTQPDDDHPPVGLTPGSVREYGASAE